MSEASLPHCKVCNQPEYDCICGEDETTAKAHAMVMLKARAEMAEALGLKHTARSWRKYLEELSRRSATDSMFARKIDDSDAETTP